ncbi:uncharacterized protein LOC135848837 [Planococcus citri]|uniref:uncharacterized protein LOC135848837 n=1 Tax=Planococcus citri TaxID=170843 RepID=UPI0031FA3567
MSDYEENVVIKKRKSRDEEEAEGYNEYCRHKCDCCFNYDSYRCKRCKVEESYESVILSPTILTNAPKLQEIASVTVAASLWNHVNIPETVFRVTDVYTKNSAEWEALSEKVYALVDELKLPKSIAEYIVACACEMADAITAWVSYHHRTVFLENGPDKLLYSLVYHIVWNPNGTINCVRTARSMMTSLRLSEVEKLKFLCVYCLKDEMSEMSPLLYQSNVLDYVSCEENPLIYYWYRYFRNELNKVPTIKVDDDSEPSIDVYMFRNDKVDNWSAKQYFFQRLNRDEQVREAIWLIDKHGIVYQKAVMLKLDEIQRLSVYMDRAVQIIANYSRLRICSRFILMTWFEARHLLSQDQFLTIFRDLLKIGMNDTVMKEIWTSADDNLKHHVVSFNDHEMVQKVLFEWKGFKDPDFIYVLLHDCNAAVRKSIAAKTFFKTYAEKLLMESRIKGFDRLLEFCLPEAEESNQFRISLMENNSHIRDISLKFYSTGDVNGLNKFLKQLLPSSPDFIIEYKKNLLASKRGINECISVMDNEVDILEAIFKDTLTNAKSIQDFRRKMILSPSGVAKLKSSIINKRFSAVQICIDRFLTSDEVKTWLKKKITGEGNTMELDLIMAILRNNDASYLQTVMMWHFGNENAIKEFKSSFPLRSIFIDTLKDIIFYRHDRLISKCVFKDDFKPSDFDVIERLLNWYFDESPTEVKAYKRKIIYSYGQIEVFCTLLKGNSGHSRLKSMLDWFFKDDTEYRATFKSRGSRLAALL